MLKGRRWRSSTSTSPAVERWRRRLAVRGGVPLLRCDITREANVERAMAETIAAFGGLDILINNAGVNTYFDATTMTEEEWERVFAVDLKGAWLCAKHALPAMREGAADRSSTSPRSMPS